MALDLRQTFDKVRNAGVAGALALALVFAPVAATQADNASTPQAQQVSAQQIKVPMKDYRGAETRALQMGAAMASKNAQVIIFFGDREDAFASMKEGARSALAEGIPLKVVVIGSPLSEQTVDGVHIAGTNQIMFYADGNLTSTINNPGEGVGAEVLAQLRSDYREVLIPLRTLAMNTATPSSP